MGACLLLPDPERLVTRAPVVMRRHQMTSRAEVAVDDAVGAEEALRLARRLEPLHLPLASPRGPVRVLGPVVEVAALSVLDLREDVAVRDAVAVQAVSNDATRLVLEVAEQALEEAFGGVSLRLACTRMSSTTLFWSMAHQR